MIYSHPESKLIIDATGGYKILEKLGFKSEEEAKRAERKARSLESLKAFGERRRAEKEKIESDLFGGT